MFRLIQFLSLFLLVCPYLLAGSQNKNNQFNKLYDLDSNKFFQEIARLKKTLKKAQYCDLAYKSDEVILKAFPTAKIFVAKESGVRFFTHKKGNELYISFRGSRNFYNWLINAKFDKELDQRLNIWFHRGFLKAAQEIYKILKASDVIQADKVYIQGHSLGGAIALILSHWYRLDGLPKKNLEITTFGQPRVTNSTGAEKLTQLQDFEFDRVKMDVDIVPFLPPKKLHYAHYTQAQTILYNPPEQLDILKRINPDLVFERFQKMRSGEISHEEFERSYKHRMKYYVQILQRMVSDRNPDSIPFNCVDAKSGQGLPEFMRTLGNLIREYNNFPMFGEIRESALKSGMQLQYFCATNGALAEFQDRKMLINIFQDAYMETSPAMTLIGSAIEFRKFSKETGLQESKDYSRIFNTALHTAKHSDGWAKAVVASIELALYKNRERSFHEVNKKGVIWGGKRITNVIGKISNYKKPGLSRMDEATKHYLMKKIFVEMYTDPVLVRYFFSKSIGTDEESSDPDLNLLLSSLGDYLDDYDFVNSLPEVN